MGSLNIVSKTGLISSNSVKHFVHSFLEDVGKERNVTNITCRIHEIMFLIMLFMLFKFGSTMAQKSQRRSVFCSSNLKAVLSPLVLSFHFKHTFSHQFVFKKKTVYICIYFSDILYKLTKH